ncbi:MAG TPA: hypothetical protein VFO10_05465 [Oligoflexus sp.]|uniref:hypothetical protein n=1 Tax=Oligoflexus sp. TaxID=1971216 RepID=UPI002D7FEAAD|nr:hypothetical protein [Oligoflexus sp.]HET9236674.1 hypothetical protein [Oligoflexus sp.]
MRPSLAKTSGPIRIQCRHEFFHQLGLLVRRGSGIEFMGGSHGGLNSTYVKYRGDQGTGKPCAA